MYRLFGIPMNHFTDWIVDFESILFPDEKGVVDEIFEASNHEQRVAVLERFLIRRLSPETPPLYEQIQHAGNLILRQDGTMPVKKLANEVNMSERNFERHFIEKVGVPPKTFSGIARIKKAMQLIGKMPVVSWKDIGFILQYSDQAHFIHEFKKLAGKTPSEYSHSLSAFEHFLYAE